MAKKTQAEALDTLVKAFTDELGRIVMEARATVIDALTARLTVVGGVINKTKSNQAVLRSIKPLFESAMQKAGYGALVDEYVAKFNGQFVYFDEHLAEFGKTIGHDVSVTFGPRDRSLFEAQQVNTIHLLEGAIESVAYDAQRQAILSIGGMKLSELISEIADQFDKAVGEATTLADTALSSFYRTITDRGYRMVERSTPKNIEIRYKYAGPSDRVTRPFCQRLLDLTAKGVTFTREEIDAMDNGQIPGVFTSCGGFNCRHQWLIVQRILDGGDELERED